MFLQIFRDIFGFLREIIGLEIIEPDRRKGIFQGIVFYDESGGLAGNIYERNGGQKYG